MRKTAWFVCLSTLLLVIGVSSAFAQKYEVHPYAGGLFLGDFGRSNFTERQDFVNPGTFGLKGGMRLTDHFGIEGNVGYMNNFTFRENPLHHRIHAMLWEGAGTYDFVRSYHHVHPFVSFGVGAMTMKVHSGAVDNFDDALFAMPIQPENVGPMLFREFEPLIVSNGDTFFDFSYGGGLKAERLWGPVGLRADLRGRTMPNFYGEPVTGMEATGGLTFSWGER